MNKVLLYGRLTKDPELKTVGDDKKMTRFNIACNRRTKEGGADFIPCLAWGKTAETLTKYFHKGNRIAATGRIQTGNYEGKDGNKVYTTDIVIEEIEFVESKAENAPEVVEVQKDGEIKRSKKKVEEEDDFMNIPSGLDAELPFA